MARQQTLTDSQAVGSRLREARKKSGETIIEAARKLRVTRYEIQAWEHGRKMPSFRHGMRACKLYGISWRWLSDG